MNCTKALSVCSNLAPCHRSAEWRMLSGLLFLIPLILIYDFFAHFFSICHPEEHRDEGSRVHPRVHPPLCSRDPSLHFVPLWMTNSKNEGVSNYKSTFHFVIQSEAKNLKSASRCIQILPPYGRLDDRMFRKFNSDTPSFFYMSVGSTSKGSP